MKKKKLVCGKNMKTQQLTGKLESQYLIDKAEMMTRIARLKENYNNQIKNLHRRLEDMYGVKLTEIHKKHFKLEKQLTDAAQ